jgi:hypothetical protein
MDNHSSAFPHPFPRRMITAEHALHEIFTLGSDADSEAL